MTSEISQEELLCYVYEGAVHGIVAIDSHDRISAMNPAVERLRGIARDVAMGKPVAEVFTLLDAQTRTPLELPDHARFLRNPDPLFLGHSILVTSSTREVFVDAIACPTLNDTGALIGYSLILSDIRDTVTRERDALERQKVEAIGSMAGNMAHDFNEWLTVISGHASCAIDSLIPNTRAHHAALRILDAAEEASGMVKRLMAVASATSSVAKTEMEIVDTGKIVTHALRLAQATFIAPHITCKAIKTHATPYVAANASQLLSCLVNIIRNAAEAMPEGGKITIDTSEREVAGQAYVVVRVRDSGVGITRTNMRQLFDPFFSTKPDTDAGTGLGLTVVQSLVEIWGGFVKVRSRPGHGSSFRMFLPKAAQQPEAPSPQSEGGTVLVIDDSSQTVAEVREILERAEYNVLCASSVDQGLSLYLKHRRSIQVTIIDVIMPGQDVPSLIDGILQIDPTASIIMTSGFSRDYVRSCLERGAWRFLQKPMEESQLLSSVRRVMEQRSNDKKDVVSSS